MAGIGFELKKMIDSGNGLLHTVKSYGLAAATINGPMVLCMITVSIARCLLGNGEHCGIPADAVLTTITYAFILSSIITGSYSLVLIRYISDCIYNKEYSKVFPSLLGAIIPALFFSIAASLGMVLWGGLKIEYSISVSTLFSVVSIVWLEMVYLSAVKNYKAIIKGFFLGNILGIFLLVFTGTVSEGWKLQYVFFSFTIAFTVTAALLMYQIRKFFRGGLRGAIEWIGYFKKFSSLFLTGLFYTLGLYFLCIYYRFCSGEIFINGLIAMKPEFDLPFFWAVLGIIPGLVYFSVRFETLLHTHCRELYSKINNNGTGSEIDHCIKNVITTVKYCCIKLALVQATVMLSMLLAAIAKMKMNETVYVFFVLTIGLSTTIFMYAIMLIVLYFDGRGCALIISSIYMSLSIILTLFFNNSASGLAGLGFMIASVTSMLISIILLIIFMLNIKNYIFIMK